MELESFTVAGLAGKGIIFDEAPGSTSGRVSPFPQDATTMDMISKVMSCFMFK
jgi:hypothetical protein